jgi:hypothetical protein
MLRRYTRLWRESTYFSSITSRVGDWRGRGKKNRNPKVPAVQLAGCPDKNCVQRALGESPFSNGNSSAGPRPRPFKDKATSRVFPQPLKPCPPEKPYALRRGRIVRSRTCVRMLDICMPFSCATKGMMSITNWSSISSRTSS